MAPCRPQAASHNSRFWKPVLFGPGKPESSNHGAFGACGPPTPHRKKPPGMSQGQLRRDCVVVHRWRHSCNGRVGWAACAQRVRVWIWVRDPKPVPLPRDHWLSPDDQARVSDRQRVCQGGRAHSSHWLTWNFVCAPKALSRRAPRLSPLQRQTCLDT